MKKFMPLEEMFDRIKSDKLNTWFDRLTFGNIFVVWACIITIFGFVYHFFSGSISNLFYTRTGEPVTRLLDSIYFSFITATTTGFGDIIPSGFFKVIAIFEVISGLLLLAFVTSKLVSIKQNVILNEIYEISFNERISRMRSSLLVFRQNISRLMSRIDEGSVKKREISEIYVFVSSMYDILNQVMVLTNKPKKNGFTKVIDPINAELLFNSMLQSFEKLEELLGVMNEKRIDWRRDITIDLIKSCISLNEELFRKLDASGLPKKTASDMAAKKDIITDRIRKDINHIMIKSYAEIQKTLKALEK
ncbi:MAG: potassium channel family protein [Candidatus Woesearchaeota archaeon]|nr:potassium channel family protein [Candidatus Woesearchaeota archaeon]